MEPHLFSSPVIGSVYVTNYTRMTVERIRAHCDIAPPVPIVHVDISFNMFRYAHFYIYDSHVLNDVERWIDYMDKNITYCVYV
jgi:hypothetical protein